MHLRNDKNNNPAPLLVANQDLMRRMEQIARRVAGTLQKKQDNSYSYSYSTNESNESNESNDSSNVNGGGSSPLNSTEWIVVHLAREILQRHVRVQAMIAEGHLQAPASPSTAQCATASGSASNEKQDHWNPVFLSWDTLIANWIRDGRLVPMMVVMNDAHSFLQQQQEQYGGDHPQGMDAVAIDRVSQMLGIAAEQWEILSQRTQKQGELKNDTSNSKTDPAPALKAAYPCVSMTTEVTMNPSPGARPTTADDPLPSASTTAQRTSPGRNSRGRPNASSYSQDRDRPYTQSQLSAALDTRDDGLLDMIESELERRGQAKADRDFDVADEIQEELASKYNVFISDRLREWSVGDKFGNQNNLNSPQRLPPGPRLCLACGSQDHILNECPYKTREERKEIYALHHALKAPDELLLLDESPASSPGSAAEAWVSGTGTRAATVLDRLRASQAASQTSGAPILYTPQKSPNDATASTTVADAFSGGPQEPVPFRHAGPVADFVLASSSNYSDSKNQNKTLTAATSMDSTTQVPVSVINSDPELNDGENDADIGPADGKFLVGIKVQQRYLQLCHANKCKSDDCPSELNCTKVKLLCRHIKDCRSDSCGYPGCLSSRAVLCHAAVLSHIRRCHDGTSCQVCVSTRDCSATEPSPPVFPTKVSMPMQLQMQVQVHQEQHRPFKKRRVTLDTANV